MAVVAELINDHDNLRDLDRRDVPSALAHVYLAANMAHPFREGNGRTQRDFLTALAAESGHTIDWTAVKGGVNDRVSYLSLMGKPELMPEMFEGIVKYAPGEVRHAADAARLRSLAFPRSPGVAGSLGHAEDSDVGRTGPVRSEPCRQSGLER